MHTQYRAIARVSKTHGRKGEVVTVSVDGLPLLVREGLEVAVVPPALKGPRFHVVASCSDSAAGQLVRFDDVCDLGAASKLVGKTLLAKVEDLPDDFALYDHRHLVGREVRDEKHGLIGTISEIMLGPANDVWVVEGPLGEVMVPAVDEFVLSVEGEGPVEVALPEGLISGVDDLPEASGDGEA